MGFSNLMKRLKKRLKNKKRWLALGAILFAAGAPFFHRVSSGGPLMSHAIPAGADTRPAFFKLAPAQLPSKDAPSSARPVSWDAVWAEIGGGEIAREVLLVKSYVCGEETEALGSLIPDEVFRLHEEHPERGASLDAGGQILFTEKIEDLSPRCKQDAYFGLDKNGNLSLFEGLPSRDKVIRTFFQLNIELLKSGLPHQTVEDLYHGIKIADLAEYNSVISTFADYAVNGKSRM